MKTTLQTLRGLPGLVLGLLLLRLATLGLYPLMDTTEARYGEMARKMVELGDWVTPWFDYGVPFWGKPPLSFWLTALSFKLFGINEFAARLPHFLLGLAVAGLIWGMARRLDRAAGVYSLALLAGALLFLVAAGTVMTDMSLVLGTTLALRGFWLGLYGAPGERRREGWLLFLGLAIGLLAKGPLVLVIVGLPLALWTLIEKQLGVVWRGLPWLRGTGAALLVTLPWYALAEQRTPGFLHYFLVGEHWHRFLTPGWKGDLYGNAHLYPYGSIWKMALAACMPWTLLLPLMAWRGRRQPAPMQAPDRRLWRYLLLWGLMPGVFFTFASNILATYFLPALPALALLGADWLSRQPQRARTEKWLGAGLLLSAAFTVAGLGFLHHSGYVQKRSAKMLVMDAAAQRQGDEALYVVSGHKTYSAVFYSRGQAHVVKTAAQFFDELGERRAQVALRPATVKSLPLAQQRCLQPLARHGDFVLYRANGAGTARCDAVANRH